MGWRGLDSGDRARLGIDADHDDRVAPVSLLNDRCATDVPIVTPHPCEKHAVAGRVEVQWDVMPTMSGRGLVVEREIGDPRCLGEDVDEELGSLSSDLDPVAYV